MYKKRVVHAHDAVYTRIHKICSPSLFPVLVFQIMIAVQVMFPTYAFAKHVKLHGNVSLFNSNMLIHLLMQPMEKGVT